MTRAFPLAWPAGWPRTKTRAKSKFRTTLAGAINNVHLELDRVGAKSFVMSSNVTLGTSRPSDPGVALYFVRAGRQLCIPSDRWDTVEANLQAVAKTIEAFRGIERWGAKQMVDAAFAGFVSLPPPDPAGNVEPPWRTVLGVADDATLPQVEAAYRDLARRCHPDVGGSAEAMARINRARDMARKELGG